MADRRRRTSIRAEPRSPSANGAAAAARLLQHECSVLLELYRKKEHFPAEVSDGRLVSVPPPSSQSDTKDKLWLLHSALLQCRVLLDRAITKEEEELGSGVKGEYENQRKMVKQRLSILISKTAELQETPGGCSVLTTSVQGLQMDGPSLSFELKVWVYRIFKEVDHWTKMTITTLQGLPPVTSCGPARNIGGRDLRSSRR